MPQNPKRRKIIRRILWGLFFVLLGGILFNTVRIYLYSFEFYDTSADVAIVLGAGIEEGELSPVFRERVNHGINLYQQGMVKAIIFTGGVGEGNTLAESRVAMNFALAAGVPDSAIFIEETSTITYTNLVNAKAIMGQQGFKSVLLVSDPLHEKRAMRYCHRLDINALPSPTPTTMYRTWKSKSQSLAYESLFFNLDIGVGRWQKKYGWQK